ncbi:MAG: magnesium transporter [Desulfohalobiaceae bacterium]|nr:magnesium transporter [Desulfohalobiaceae bacterium]
MPETGQPTGEERIDRELPEQDASELAHPADTADHLESLELEEQIKFIKRLPVRDAASSIAEMGHHERIELFQRLNLGMASRVIANMAPDDATDILAGLEEEHRRSILARIPPRDRVELRELLTYDPDTAGGVMNTDALVLHQDLDSDQAIALIREQVEDKEIPYYAYVVDDESRLMGVVSLRELMIAPHTMHLEDLIQSQRLIAVHHETDQEEVAKLISNYNFLALPVVDDEGKFLGVVTVDDVINIIHEEASEDMQSMVGAGMDETTESPWLYSVKKRVPWLLLNMVNSAVAAYVVHLFEDNIAKITLLAVLMPVVANMAGNSGQQALAVMIRQMAVEKFERKKFWLGVLREARIGFINGIMLGGTIFCVVWVLTQNLLLSGVVGTAMWMDMFVGCTAGASIPLVLHELGRDPAQASTIFLTTITDSVGFLSLLSLAGLVLLGG